MSIRPVTVRIFGLLRPYIKIDSEKYEIDIEVPSSGISAKEIAKRLNLPMDKVEAVFINGHIEPLDYNVMPGDRIAFCPHGTPGPYRLFLGMVRANKKSS